LVENFAELCNGVSTSLSILLSTLVKVLHIQQYKMGKKARKSLIGRFTRFQNIQGALSLKSLEVATFHLIGALVAFSLLNYVIHTLI
jgi:hypothetical protein